MPASAGTPTIWEKIGAVFNLDGTENASVLAGDERDLTTAEQALLNLFKPIFNLAESSGLSDLTNFLQTILADIPTITSISQAVGIVNGALSAENGTLKQQAVSLGQTALTTLVSAALSAIGKVNVPV